MNSMLLKGRTGLPQLYRISQKKKFNVYACARAASSSAASPKPAQEKRKLVFDNRSPSLQEFLAQANQTQLDPLLTSSVTPENVPYLNVIGPSLGRGRKFYIEVYGCQVRLYHRYAHFGMNGSTNIFADECE